MKPLTTTAHAPSRPFLDKTPFPNCVAAHPLHTPLSMVLNFSNYPSSSTARVHSSTPTIPPKHSSVQVQHGRIFVFLAAQAGASRRRSTSGTIGMSAMLVSVFRRCRCRCPWKKIMMRSSTCHLAPLVSPLHFESCGFGSQRKLQYADGPYKPPLDFDLPDHKAVSWT